MADDLTAVDAEFAPAVAEDCRSGGTATKVAAVVVISGLERTRFYKYMKRFEAASRMSSRFRRPSSCDTQVSAEAVELILGAERRAEFDFGADAVRLRLEGLPEGDPWCGR